MYKKTVPVQKVYRLNEQGSGKAGVETGTQGAEATCLRSHSRSVAK